MKFSYALAAAATIEQASATYGIGGDQVPGYDWNNTPQGPVGGYGGCNFKGWTCKKKASRRDMLAGRQNDGSNVIEATVGAEGTDNPTITAGDDIGTFDINNFSVESEFDARFELHYTMPDGSTCKQSSTVSSQGTSIVNTQCGGAKSVTLVLPENGQNVNGKRTLQKKSCQVKCHKIVFYCKPPPGQTTTRTPPAQTTTRSTTRTTILTTTTTPPGQTTTQTTSSSSVQTTTLVQPGHHLV
ncbi:hypothetical protein NQ176_g9067 [Zarea fungicola]|uniref:Uncharacterized protein n=1 Tax=Zarea fungicola TaxID=93591 RepID=A0ACC1MPB5_9HYPO|nr:hypothetical protein NQ176_g9067 [Lecanicillium fungicola]